MEVLRRTYVFRDRFPAFSDVFHACHDLHCCGTAPRRGKWSLLAMSYILTQRRPHSCNKQYHSPFSSVVERGTCTIAQACRGHSFNPGRGQSRFTFDLLKGFTPHARFLVLVGQQRQTRQAIICNRVLQIERIDQQIGSSNGVGDTQFWRKWMITTWPKFEVELADLALTAASSKP